MQDTTTTPSLECPTCGRPAIRMAFPTSTAYVSDSVGHVFANPMA
jgi:hypothetical protein